MTDRHTTDTITSADLDDLYDERDMLRRDIRRAQAALTLQGAELEQAEAAIARVHALHRKATHGPDCVHCAAFGPGYDNTWPCQTIRALDGSNGYGDSATEAAAPATVTDPAWLRQPYAAALHDARKNGLGGMSEAEAVSHMAAAVMRVRDRHVDQLRQRLELAEHFHQDIASVQQRADRLAAELTGWRNLAAEHQQATIAAHERADQYAATLTRIRRTIHIADAEDATDWQRGYRACANRVTTELDHSAPAAEWTPPPPGSTREQLPDHILDLIRDRLPDYLSTACQTADTVACAACYPGSGVPRPQYDEIREHAERLHERCRLNNKFTGQLCVCGCHPTEEQS